jgi:hypothetical protein
LLLPLRGVAAEPPTGVVASVGKDGSRAGLVDETYVVVFHLVVLERGLEVLVHLHRAVASAAPCADGPHGPIPDPHDGGGGKQPEERVLDLSFAEASLRAGCHECGFGSERWFASERCLREE